jgi:hypothetical protein
MRVGVDLIFFQENKNKISSTTILEVDLIFFKARIKIE